MKEGVGVKEPQKHRVLKKRQESIKLQGSYGDMLPGSLTIAGLTSRFFGET